MSSSLIDNGGPAYPEPERLREGAYTREHGYRNEGMSLRDWFAGLAMAALLQATRRTFWESRDETAGVLESDRAFQEGGIARDSYKAADAMLRHRSSPNPET